MVAMTTSSVAIPLLTQIYQENYPVHERGKLFSRTFMIRIATAAAFSEIAGRILSAHMSYFRWLLLVFAAAFLFTACCLARFRRRRLLRPEAPIRSGRCVRARRSGVPHHAHFVDVSGIRHADDGTVAHGISRQP
jgi:MFS family permease